MPTDVKLNAEGLPDDFLDQLRAECEGEYGEKVVGKQTLWRIVAELLARRALDNSKPAPAVGDDGMVERGVGVIARMARMRGAVGDTEAIVTWMHETRTALAAAHAQHEADAARIKELTEVLRTAQSAIIHVQMVLSLPTTGAQKRAWIALYEALENIASALAKVKP